MEITLTRTRQDEIHAAVAELEHRGWHLVGNITFHRREVKKLPKTARKERNVVYYEGSEKYYARMRKEDK